MFAEERCLLNLKELMALKRAVGLCLQTVWGWCI